MPGGGVPSHEASKGWGVGDGPSTPSGPGAPIGSGAGIGTVGRAIGGGVGVGSGPWAAGARTTPLDVCTAGLFTALSSVEAIAPPASMSRSTDPVLPSATASRHSRSFCFCTAAIGSKRSFISAAMARRSGGFGWAISHASRSALKCPALR
ncbi:MAG: hypothetical protein ACK559_26740 [bacterium]